MSEWWKTFFDAGYLTIAGQLLTEETSARQARDLWSMLDLQPGCRLLDAPCGYGSQAIAYRSELRGRTRSHDGERLQMRADRPL